MFVTVIYQLPTYQLYLYFGIYPNLNLKVRNVDFLGNYTYDDYHILHIGLSLVIPMAKNGDFTIAHIKRTLLDTAKVVKLLLIKDLIK